MKGNLLDNILINYANNFKNLFDERLVFVLPSKRSVLYVHHKLKEVYKEHNIQGIFPEVITINEFIEKTSGLILLPRVDLIYYLYQAYLEVFKDNESQPYHQFVKWASMLLNDFNDVVLFHPNDKEKQKNIFTNLKDIKEIEHWSLNATELSENQKKYLDLMRKFYDIFEKFNTTLLNNDYGYTGLLYEKALANISNNEYIKQTSQFVFAGFNALSTAEKNIFKYLKQENKAAFYWNYDTYYTQNEIYEAGYFLRENFNDFGLREDNKQSESYFDKNKNIHIISGTNDVEIALYIKQKLLEWKNNNKGLESTAIILNKPESLNLVLSAIPEEISYNVSMEYPLYLTSAYQFLSQLLKIFVQLLSSGQVNERRIYHKYFISLLLNPFFRHYLYLQSGIPENALKKIAEIIKEKNKIYISISHLNEVLVNNKDEKVFSDTEEGKKQQKDFEKFFEIFNKTEIKDIVGEINNVFQNYLSKANHHDVFTINVVQSITEQLNRIEEIINQDNQRVFKDIKDVQSLIQQIVSRESVAFKGEPLSGLQIIGILESRLLDFDTLIVPFMNEGVFPPDHQKISFLPYDLRWHYGLPTHYNDDAVFAYLFYRSLHTPENVYLIYNNSSDKEEKGIRQYAGEVSRYIQQVQYEMSEKKNINIVYSNIVVEDNQIFSDRIIEIEKNKDIIEQLKSIKYSPSSITTYLDCSLKFYFKYILKLREESDTAEELEANIEGNIFHEVMSAIYSNKNILNEDSSINVNELKNLVENQSNEIKTLITNIIQKLNLELKGKVLIQEEVLFKDIINFIQKEIKSIEESGDRIIIVHTETEKREKSFVNIDLVNVSVYGYPDRIDYIKNKKLYRVVDYKSSFGDYDVMDFNYINEFFNTTEDKKKNINKQLQLLIYIYFVLKKQMIKLSASDKITGVILPLKLHTKNENKSINQYILQGNESFGTEIKTFESVEEIENLLKIIFGQFILNNDADFKQTDNLNICRYCEYNNICRRD